MPIRGKSLGDASNQFRDHLNSLLRDTITTIPVVSVASPPDRIELSFRQHGRPTSVELQTQFGPLFLALNQRLTSTTVNGEHELHTVEYRYTLAGSPTADPIFRWEYLRQLPRDNQWCRHHLQGNIPLPWAGKKGTLTLNDLHLPTGWVTIEEVIRFCLADLKVPARSTDWDERLQDSYRQFMDVFDPGGEV